MSLKVTFEFDTAAEVINFLQGLDTGQEIQAGVDVGTPAAAAAGAKPRGRPRKDAAPAPVPAAQETATAAAPTPAAPLVPYKDFVEAATPLMDSGDEGHAALKAILQSFGAAKAPDLKPEQIGPALAKVKEALERIQAAGKTSLL